MFYYYTEVPSINHFIVKEQGETIDFSGVYETVQDVFACFPESYSHKMTQKRRSWSLDSGLDVSSLLLVFLKWSKFKMSIQTSLNKLKQANLTIPIDFLIGNDLAPQNMGCPLSSFTAQICLHDRTSGYRYSWRWSTHLLEFKLFNQADLLLE